MENVNMGCIGVSMYILENALNTERLHVLSQAIELTNVYYADLEAPEEMKAYEHIMRSAEYLHLMEHAEFCGENVKKTYFSVEIPSLYTRAFVMETAIKGLPMVKVYIPVATANREDGETFVHKALLPVLQKLFGNDLLTVRTRETDENMEFPESSEKVILSMERYNALVTA